VAGVRRDRNDVTGAAMQRRDGMLDGGISLMIWVKKTGMCFVVGEAGVEG
jgi:hypothetical protein